MTISQHPPTAITYSDFSSHVAAFSEVSKPKMVYCRLMGQSQNIECSVLPFLPNNWTIWDLGPYKLQSGRMFQRVPRLVGISPGLMWAKS